MEPTRASSSAKPGEHLGLVEPATDGPDDVVADRNPIREDDPQQSVAVDDEVPGGRRTDLGADGTARVASARRRLGRAATRSRLRRRARNPMRLPPVSSQCRGALELAPAFRTYRLAGRFSLCRHIPNALLTLSRKSTRSSRVNYAEPGRMRVDQNGIRFLIYGMTIQPDGLLGKKRGRNGQVSGGLSRPVSSPQRTATGRPSRRGANPPRHRVDRPLDERGHA